MKQFIWLVSRGKILINQERMIQRLTENDLCERCGTHVETTLHVLRDCAKSKRVWEMIGVCFNDRFQISNDI